MISDQYRMLKRVRIVWIVLLRSFDCGDASTEGEAVASSYTHRGTDRDMPPHHGSKRYLVEYTVITGKYLRSNINNSCLECSLMLSIADGGRIM